MDTSPDGADANQRPERSYEEWRDSMIAQAKAMLIEEMQK